MSKRPPEKDDRKYVARNKQALHKYFVEDHCEAGLVLLGSEVKSLREGRSALGDSYAKFRGAELFLLNCHIPPYDKAGPQNHEPLRPRKLLLRRPELQRLRTRVDEKGVTLVPLAIYFTHGLAKVDLGLCRGKRQHDHREEIRKRDADREIRRAAAR